MEISGFVACCVHVRRHTVTYQTQKSQLWLQFPDSPPEAAKAPAFAALGNQAWFLAGAGAVLGLPGKGGPVVRERAERAGRPGLL